MKREGEVHTGPAPSGSRWWNMLEGKVLSRSRDDRLKVWRFGCRQTVKRSNSQTLKP